MPVYGKGRTKRSSVKSKLVHRGLIERVKGGKRIIAKTCKNLTLLVPSQDL